MSEIRNKLFAVIVALTVIGLFCMAHTTITENEFLPSASAGSTLSENVSETVEEWIPTIVALTMVGIALTALGAQQYLRNR